MKDFLAKNRGRLIAALFIIALLTAAWFYGDGNSSKNKKDNSVPADFAGADYTLSENSTENPTENSTDESSTTKPTAEEQGGSQNEPYEEATPTPTVNQGEKNQGESPTIKPSPWGEGGSRSESDEGSTCTPTVTPCEKTTEKPPAEAIPTEKPTVVTNTPHKSTPTPAVTIWENTPTPKPSNTSTSTPTVTPTPEPEGKYTCTISIDCKTILPKLKDMNPKLKKLIPSDGVILSGETVYFNEGDSVFDVLKRVCLEKDISLEYSYVPAFKTVYIEGLADLYEFDGGNLSGWQYSVNGEFVMLGCSAKTVSDGDVIEWRYTCDMGRDL